jgi:hypothetical protein
MRWLAELLLANSIGACGGDGTLGPAQKQEGPKPSILLQAGGLSWPRGPPDWHVAPKTSRAPYLRIFKNRVVGSAHSAHAAASLKTRVQRARLAERTELAHPN